MQDMIQEEVMQFIRANQIFCFLVDLTFLIGRQ